MREIKFRYWCQFESEMYPKAYVEEHMDLAFMSELLEAAQKRYVFMQWTGLTDRNSKEIYEGDIFENHLGKYVVRFERGSFYLHNPRYISLDSEEHCDLYLSTTMDDYLGEVIGNRYENPELLVEETK